MNLRKLVGFGAKKDKTRSKNQFVGPALVVMCMMFSIGTQGLSHPAEDLAYLVLMLQLVSMFQSGPCTTGEHTKPGNGRPTSTAGLTPRKFWVSSLMPAACEVSLRLQPRCSGKC